MMLRSGFLAFGCLAAGLLTGCGESYELKLTDTYFPYGNERTAGSGVAYVLVKMMPEKSMSLEPLHKDVQVKLEETSAGEIKDVSPVFRQSMKK